MNISDIIYMYIFTLRVTLFGGYKFGGSKSTITINPYCGTILVISKLTTYHICTSSIPPNYC